MVGAVALAGSTPGTLPNPDPRDSASLTPGSAISLTPNSSCEELRMESGELELFHLVADLYDVLVVMSTFMDRINQNV